MYTTMAISLQPFAHKFLALLEPNQEGGDDAHMHRMWKAIPHILCRTSRRLPSVRDTDGSENNRQRDSLPQERVHQASLTLGVRDPPFSPSVKLGAPLLLVRRPHTDLSAVWDSDLR
jgi:hypothetical protein